MTAAGSDAKHFIINFVNQLVCKTFDDLTLSRILWRQPFHNGKCVTFIIIFQLQTNTCTVLNSLICINNI